MIRWKALFRDVIIIFLLTFLGGFVIGMAAAGTGGGIPRGAAAVSNIVFCIVGFTIAGCMAKTHRFRHLLHVAVGVWLLSFVNVLAFPTRLVHWLAGAIVIVITMLIGGGISVIFVRG